MTPPPFLENQFQVVVKIDFPNELYLILNKVIKEYQNFVFVEAVHYAISQLNCDAFGAYTSTYEDIYTGLEMDFPSIEDVYKAFSQQIYLPPSLCYEDMLDIVTVELEEIAIKMAEYIRLAFFNILGPIPALWDCQYTPTGMDLETGYILLDVYIERTDM